MSHLPSTLSASPQFSSQLGRQLGEFKLRELVSFCRQCGLPVAGTKGKLSQALLSALVMSSLFRLPSQIVSLDLGLKNFAKATIAVAGELQAQKPRLLKWEKISLNLPKVYHARQNARLLKKFSETVLDDAHEISDRIILVEKQTFRGSGLRMIPGDIISLNRVELQLHCFLLDHHVESIEPRSVAALFGLEMGKNKKKAAVEMVDQWLADDEKSPIEVPTELKSVFRHAEKKDDFADSLLQGFAYITWRNNLLTLLDKLQTKLGN